MKRILLLLTLVFSVLLFFNCNSASTKKEPVDYVNPLIGTSSSRWMLFPGPCLPFGMVKLSPDNTDEGQYKLGAGYEYKINSISGFSHVHSWMMSSMSTMPTTGELKIAVGTAEDPDAGYRSRIDNKNTEASAGYYSTILDDYSRYIISWRLTTTMAASDVTDTLEDALKVITHMISMATHKPKLARLYQEQAELHQLNDDPQSARLAYESAIQ